MNIDLICYSFPSDRLAVIYCGSGSDGTVILQRIRRINYLDSLSKNSMKLTIVRSAVLCALGQIWNIRFDLSASPALAIIPNTADRDALHILTPMWA